MTRLFRVVRRGIELARGLTAEEAAARLARERAAAAIEEPKIVIVFDPVLRRWRATCSVCGYVAVRAKREASEHVLSQHVAYAHEGRTS